MAPLNRRKGRSKNKKQRDASDERAAADELVELAAEHERQAQRARGSPVKRTRMSLNMMAVVERGRRLMLINLLHVQRQNLSTLASVANGIE